jgi:hypothetical protein
MLVRCSSTGNAARPARRNQRRRNLGPQDLQPPPPSLRRLLHLTVPLLRHRHSRRIVTRRRLVQVQTQRRQRPGIVRRRRPLAQRQHRHPAHLPTRGCYLDFLLWFHFPCPTLFFIFFLVHVSFHGVVPKSGCPEGEERQSRKGN